MLRERGETAWAWYASQTPDCSPLDRSAYPSIEFSGGAFPWPEWACRAPDGGVHIHHRRLRLDVHLAAPPKRRLQFGWTCEFSVKLVDQTWLSRIEDLLVDADIAIGDVFVAGRKLVSWRTLHGSNAPALLSSEGWSKVCPICGSVYSTLHGREFFVDPAARSMPVIVNRSGIFIRRDVFETRRLPVPIGAFKPDWVFLEEPH